ncbi:MAG: hypothetical protein J6J43_01315, partial [Oscillospiraceae bacterium]|nr:hypothetical protein [Oscillospiraceae bacterium]
MKKRIISLLLAVMMVVGMLPMTVLAEDACTHAAAEAVYSDNADGTHTITYACKSCGKAVANAADAVAMDFTAFAAAASEQSWWDELRVHSADSNIHYQGALAADTAEEKAQYEAAYASLREYAQTFFGWTIVEGGTTDVNNSGRAKKLYFNAAEDAAWGMDFAISPSYKTWGEAYTMLEMSVDAPAAGTYELDLTYFEDLSGAKFDLHVNPVLTGRTPDAESKVISALNTRNSGNAPVDYAAGEVVLKEGTNSVIIYINADTVGAELKLDSITFTPVSLTGICADEEDGDGKCDDCAAVIGECQHREIVTTKVSGEDKTHTISSVCKFCGEAAADRENALTIDFMAFAAAASEQTWWAGLYDPVADDGIKQYGYIGMTDDTTAAYNAMVAWQKENLCWSINASSDFTNSGRAKNLYINSNEDAAWGVGFSTYYRTWGDVYTQLLLDVTAPAAGTYDLNLDYLQDTGYGCFTVFVNGVQVGEQVNTSGEAAQLTAALGTVTLNEGNNQIAVKLTADRNGTASNYATSELALCAIDLAPIDVTGSCADADGDGKCDVCDAQIGECSHAEASTEIVDNGNKTHSIVTHCPVCDEDVAADTNVTSVDFMAFGAAASEQTWWAGLQDYSGEAGVKMQGTFAGATNSDENKAAYNAMNAWLAENTCWSIDEANTSFTYAGRMKNLYINSNDGAAWGIRFVTYYQTWGNPYAQLMLNVDVPAAGTYDLNLEYLQNTANGCFTVYVNGTKVGEQINTNGAQAVMTAELGTVTLAEGSNTVNLIISADRGGVTQNVTTQIDLRSIDFAPINVTGACADDDGDGKCDVCGAVIGSCKHAVLNKEVSDNGDKTHDTTYTCEACGEAVGNEAETLCVDFKAFAQDASSEGFWTGLMANTDAAVKSFGGSAATADNNKAYQNMISWQGENYDWAIVEAGSDFSNTGRNKRVDLNSDADANWGINFYTYYNDWAGVYNVFKLAVYAREAGTYDMSVDYLQTTRGASFTVSVNGTQIGDEIASVGEVARMVANLGTVELVEGENIIDVVMTKNFQGTTTRLSSDLSLNAIDFVPVAVTEDCADTDKDTKCDDCGAVIGGCEHAAVSAVTNANGDGTHTVSYVCDACGEEAESTEGTITMDFLYAVQLASQNSLWNKLRQSNDPDVVYYGYKDAADAENDPAVSYMDLLAMNNLIESNFDWNIDEEMSLISDSGIYKRVYMNGADDAQWAFRFVPTMLTWSVRDRTLYFTLDVAEAGTYAMDFEYLQRAAVGTDMTNSGAQVDIMVNDEVICSGLKTAGAVEVIELDVGEVELVKGENSIAITVTANKDGGVTNINSSVDVRKIDFTPVAKTAACEDADKDGVCDTCGDGYSCSHENAETTTVTNDDETHTTTTVCGECGTTVSSVTEDCTDEDANLACDVCGGTLICKHETTIEGYIGNGNGTHEVTTTCDVCGETTSVVADCADEDEDGYCDLCEDELEAACDHAETTSETVYNGDKTHTTTVTCVCGEVVSTVTADCVDEDKDCACDVCEGVIKTITKTTVAGSNM